MFVFVCALDYFLVFSASVLRQIARYLPHHTNGNASKTHPFRSSIFIRPFLSLFPVCLPAFIRQTARYHPENNSQTEAEQNLNDRLLNRPSDSPLRQKFPVSVGRTPFQPLKPPDKVLRVWPTDKACPHNTARWAHRPLPPFARKFIISAQKSSDLLPKHSGRHCCRTRRTTATARACTKEAASPPAPSSHPLKIRLPARSPYPVSGNKDEEWQNFS